MDPAAKQAVRQAAGAENFADDRETRLIYGGADHHGREYLPEAVVRARDTAAICRVMAACQAHRVPVVARGAGSGLTGGGLPVAGGVILDLAGLNRILAINPADQTAVVEPGVVTAHLQEAVRREGLFYPPDPASVNFSTIGGNVAENAGGLKAVKYGVTRDYVLGIKAVLPDGRLFQTGTATIKSVVGYDLTRLLVGSEGTLAVMVEFTLRLLPLPEARATLSGLFPTLAGAAEAVRLVLASGIRPVALEFMDRQSIQAVEAYAQLGLPPAAAALVLVEVDGPGEVVDRQARELAGLLREAGGDPVEVAATPAEAERLWRARRAVGPSLFQLGPDKLNEDVAVPLGRLAEMVDRLQGIARARGVTVATFGHAGDGNLHVNVMHDHTDPSQQEAAREAVSDIFAHTLALGGTLSGEHGVGTAKLGFVGAEIHPVALELMQGIKRLFDPANILNPHKAIPGPEMLP
ncbi:MAG: FAD-binding protein [Deltaproteobacteria bacterium]|nr:FAD-binding protein [Deltaproteobacteria bacterium]